MKIAILGGSGFLGRSLTQKFCGSGHTVLTISRSPMACVSSNHRHYESTLDDRATLSEILDGADYLFYLASDTTPGVSRLQPAMEVINNVMPLASMLEHIQGLQKLSVVYVSSGGTVYDTRKGDENLSEGSATRPISYYGAGKVAMESFLQAFHHQCGHGVVILRPSNVYGPGQIPKRSFGIVPTLCEALLRGETFQIWGDGSAVRDFLYVEDFGSLCEKILDADWTSHTCKVLNAGVGKGHSVLDLCGLLQEISGLELNVTYHPARGVDVPRIVLDCREAQEVLGWTATTNLAEGLEQTWHWYRNREA